jgi:tRNA-binding EMAP/Myf-like protein
VVLEPEGIEDKAAALRPYVIARVISAEQHPNADRLRVCQVDAAAPEQSMPRLSTPRIVPTDRVMALPGT